ncbi:MAG: hypothetical protein JWO22_3559 [Frankiales bacterium]|nr:hypothetical protein [Frankiales bacterium]
MRRIIYASRAVHDFTDSDLVNLLLRARAVNEDHHVTGMLVYSARSFLQLFEGEEFDVEVVWDRIRLDDRHIDLRVLQDGPAGSRQYADWSMGFEHVDAAELERTLPGYRASVAYPFVSAELVARADTAETLLSLYARRS